MRQSLEELKIPCKMSAHDKKSNARPGIVVIMHGGSCRIHSSNRDVIHFKVGLQPHPQRRRCSPPRPQHRDRGRHLSCLQATVFFNKEIRPRSRYFHPEDFSFRHYQCHLRRQRIPRFLLPLLDLHIPPHRSNLRPQLRDTRLSVKLGLCYPLLQGRKDPRNKRCGPRWKHLSQRSLRKGYRQQLDTILLRRRRDAAYLPSAHALYRRDVDLQSVSYPPNTILDANLIAIP